MAKLIYLTTASLDGFVEDEAGDLGWTAPSAEVHAFIYELLRPVGTHLYGRRNYETMAVWQDWPMEGQPENSREFAEIWRAADKVVYSRSLAAITTPKTRLEREFEPEEVRRLKASAERDLVIGGATLAGQALRAGLVEECHLFLVPILLGGGKSAFPRGARLELSLVEQRGFGDGRIYLRYRTAAAR